MAPSSATLAAPGEPPSPTGQPQLVPPTPIATPVQSPVKLHDPCEPVDALGRTADGVAVRCVRGDDGVARWQID